MSEELGNVGAVSQPRYEQIVAELRSAAGRPPPAQFTIGDRALEIEPMGPGSTPVQSPAWAVKQSLIRMARDIGLPVTTVEQARWTASRWPADKRRKTESFMVHQVLARIEDATERFTAIDSVPSGRTHWTLDDARHRVETQTNAHPSGHRAPHPRPEPLPTEPMTTSAERPPA
ncbi:DUF6192 family protein [Streptomyces sp. NPDC127038]|uniref:DUF6192 family protein n=1 Tax=Streptomyces sp. NPDC127038 TaxID=3347114 RepID=UPI00364A585A